MEERTLYFEDYEVGYARTTFGRTITETDVVLHAGHTGDFYPHHMDAEWMAKSEFGQRIAHGTLVFAVAVGMTAGTVNPVAFSYGYDRLRFIKPVHIGDTIHVEVEISGTRDNPKDPDSGFVDEIGRVLNQHGDVVLVFTHVYLVRRRQAAPSGNR